MERARAHRLPPLLSASLIVLAVLIAIYLPVRVRLARSERSRETPPRGTVISIFLTDQLAGYREPCG